jgi:hypothetical protein
MTDLNIRTVDISFQTRQDFNPVPVDAVVYARMGMWGERMFGSAGFFGSGNQSPNLDATTKNIRTNDISFNIRSV